MAKKKNKEDIMTKVPEEQFKFLSPEEIDGRITKIIDKARQGKNNMWSECDKLLRDQVIFDLIGQGLSCRRLLEELMSRWGISYSTAESYYYAAIKKLRESNEKLKESWKEILISRLEAVMEEASQNHDRPSYLKACKQLAELTGANAPKEVTLTNTDLTFNFQ